jgi:hypothetical protein
LIQQALVYGKKLHRSCEGMRIILELLPLYRTINSQEVTFEIDILEPLEFVFWTKSDLGISPVFSS